MGAADNWRSMRQRFLVAVILADLFVAGVTTFSLYRSYATYGQMARVAADSMSKVLRASLDDCINKIDLILLVTRDEIARQRADGRLTPARLQALLKAQSPRMPRALGLRVTDKDGNVIGAATDVRWDHADAAKMASFRHWQNNDRDELFIAPPAMGPVSGAITIHVARRLNNPDGSFAGQIYAAISVQTLEQMFEAIDLGGHGSVTLTNEQAQMMARHPNPLGDLALATAPTTLPVLRGQIEAGKTEGAYHARSPLDGVERNYFFRRVGDWPFYVLVGVADADYLTHWWREVLTMGGLAAVMVIFGTALGWRLMRDSQRLEHANRELSRQESALAMFRQAIDQSNDAVMIIDPVTSRLLDFNQTACQQLGYSRLELTGKSLLEIDLELAGEGEWSHVRDAYSQPNGITFQRIHQRKDGSRFPVDVGLRLAHIDGQQVLISIERDATEKRRVEQERQARAVELRESNAALTQSNADLERFAYVASHDLQTPLRNIISFTQLLERREKDRLSEDGREFLGFIVDGGKRMSALISDLLQYARVSSQGKPLVAVPVRRALDDALANLDSLIRDTGAEIVIGDLPLVMADESQLVSLLQNLLSNALKYRVPDRPVRVEISAQPRNSHRWCITVADNGMGIDPAYHSKIFEIFQRLNPTAGIEGTGIGLTVCQRIARRFGGDIWVESVPGGGAQFRFTVLSASGAAAGMAVS